MVTLYKFRTGYEGPLVDARSTEAIYRETQVE